MLVAIRLEEELVDKIRGRAKERGITNSQVVAELFTSPAPTPSPVEDKLIAPLTPSLVAPLTPPTTTSFDPEPEPESLDLPFDCCKELIITNGAKRCQHWHRRGYDYIHSITRRLSSEYNPDGEYDPEYCEYL